MKAIEPIKYGIDMTTQMCMGALGDLTDAEMLHRPHPGCNHINWQLGHLIVSEHGLISKEFPKALPPLPAGFAEKYSMETTKVDDPKKLATKAELMAVAEKQHAAAVAALDKLSDSELDRKLEGWAPNVGALFQAASGAHWMMHFGQWSVIRRQLGRAPMF